MPTIQDSDSWRTPTARGATLALWQSVGLAGMWPSSLASSRLDEVHTRERTQFMGTIEEVMRTLISNFGFYLDDPEADARSNPSRAFDPSNKLCALAWPVMSPSLHSLPPSESRFACAHVAHGRVLGW